MKSSDGTSGGQKFCGLEFLIVCLLQPTTGRFEEINRDHSTHHVFQPHESGQVPSLVLQPDEPAPERRTASGMDRV
jgi:hypothetical protein